MFIFDNYYGKMMKKLRSFFMENIMRQKGHGTIKKSKA